MNTAVLGVSSVTGSNMSALVNDIATVAMSLPNVNESVPWAYRDFGAALRVADAHDPTAIPGILAAEAAGAGGSARRTCAAIRVKLRWRNPARAIPLE